MSNQETQLKQVWVFLGIGRNPHPSAVFTDRHLAHEWIKKNKLKGILTAYPLDIGVYDWAVANGYFKPKNETHTSPEFIQSFSNAAQEHYHYEEDEDYERYPNPNIGG